VTSPLESLGPRQQRGSKPRCHRLTHGDRRGRASALTALIEDWGTVDANAVCMPDGFADKSEAQLHSAKELLPDGRMRAALTCWWLAVPSPKATMPNWDIACTCRVGDKPGLLLIEAKAHHGELEEAEAGKALKPPVSANSMRNHVRIGACLDEANIALAAETGQPWALSRDHHYQMSNRFAWAWKLTELGMPVILVYLGFLGCDDMAKDRAIIETADQWQQLVRKHSAGIAPTDIWDRSWELHGRTFVPLIRSLTVPLESDA
jgi:hypothetical protein